MKDVIIEGKTMKYKVVLTEEEYEEMEQLDRGIKNMEKVKDGLEICKDMTRDAVNEALDSLNKVTYDIMTKRYWDIITELDDVTRTLERMKAQRKAITAECFWEPIGEL